MKLYDTAADVVRKALRGLEMPPARAALLGGIPEPALMAFLRGAPSGPWLSRLAEVLGLDPVALTSVDTPHKAPTPPPMLHQVALPFDGDEVNVWHLEHPEGSLCVDAGFQTSDLANATHGMENFDLLITHPHRDHVGGISAVSGKARTIYSPTPLPGASDTAAGQTFHSGPWRIEVFGLAGHHPSAVGYRIRGADQDFVAVGDAVFARSIGGCAGGEAYQHAKESILGMWAKLEPGTLILTGHGPLTTVARETEENPFLAAWLKG
ncbi:MBL fold metallo-hydrolase [Haloferula rosea]|uniref:Metallo-beta-lactamase domain-containing protein n=1 Tax=Haloferula rosea TaxID=490093 RepID=A0A934RAW2_9BACT|nr:hypothetical protein [Haloferula rosea]MBK1826242.1 hypothetical protein [Haloferula rosea]